MTKQSKKKSAWDLYCEESEKIDQRIENRLTELNKEIYVQYSCSPTYQYKDEKIPIDNLNETAATGKVIFYEDDLDWGGKQAEIFISPVMENPTWLDVAICANDMIETVRDFHHCFLEGIDLIGEPLQTQIKEKHNLLIDTKIYCFHMGS